MFSMMQYDKVLVQQDLNHLKKILECVRQLRTGPTFEFYHCISLMNIDEARGSDAEKESFFYLMHFRELSRIIAAISPRAGGLIAKYVNFPWKNLKELGKILSGLSKSHPLLFMPIIKYLLEDMKELEGRILFFIYSVELPDNDEKLLVADLYKDVKFDVGTETVVKGLPNIRKFSDIVLDLGHLRKAISLIDALKLFDGNTQQGREAILSALQAIGEQVKNISALARRECAGFPFEILKDIRNRIGDVWDNSKQAEAFLTLVAEAKSDFASLAAQLISLNGKLKAACAKIQNELLAIYNAPASTADAVWSSLPKRPNSNRHIPLAARFLACIDVPIKTMEAKLVGAEVKCLEKKQARQVEVSFEIFLVTSLSSNSNLSAFKNSCVFTKTPVALFYVDEKLKRQHLLITKEVLIKKLTAIGVIDQFKSDEKGEPVISLSNPPSPHLKELRKLIADHGGKFIEFYKNVLFVLNLSIPKDKRESAAMLGRIDFIRNLFTGKLPIPETSADLQILLGMAKTPGTLERLLGDTTVADRCFVHLKAENPAEIGEQGKIINAWRKQAQELLTYPPPARVIHSESKELELKGLDKSIPPLTKDKWTDHRSLLTILRHALERINKLTVAVIQEVKAEPYRVRSKCREDQAFHHAILFNLTVIGGCIRNLESKRKSPAFRAVASARLRKEFEALKWIRNALLHDGHIDEAGSMLQYFNNDLSHSSLGQDGGRAFDSSFYLQTLTVEIENAVTLLEQYDKDPDSFDLERNESRHVERLLLNELAVVVRAKDEENTLLMLNAINTRFNNCGLFKAVKLPATLRDYVGACIFTTNPLAIYYIDADEKPQLISDRSKQLKESLIALDLIECFAAEEKRESVVSLGALPAEKLKQLRDLIISYNQDAKKLLNRQHRVTLNLLLTHEAEIDALCSKYRIRIDGLFGDIATYSYESDEAASGFLISPVDINKPVHAKPADELKTVAKAVDHPKHSHADHKHLLSNVSHFKMELDLLLGFRFLCVTEEDLVEKIGLQPSFKEKAKKLRGQAAKRPLKPVLRGYELYVAVQDRDLASVEKLLETEVCLDLCVEGYTALQSACMQYARGLHVGIDLEMAELLLNRGADPNQFDKHGCSPLHNAAADGDAELIELMVRCGAKPNLPNKHGLLPLQLANDRQVSRVIRRRLLVLTEMTPQEKFIQAILIEDIPLIIALIAEGKVDVNACDNRDQYPLHMACKRGNFKIVRILDRHGVKFHQLNADGDTALHMACDSDNKLNCKLVKFLLERKKIHPNIRNHNGEVVLHHAIYGNSVRLLLLLFENGADPDIAYLSFTPLLELMNSISSPNIKMVRTLLEAGASITFQSEYVGNALHHAAEHGHKSAGRLLLEFGADIYAKSKGKAFKNQTAIQIAANCKRASFLKMLRESEVVDETKRESKDTKMTPSSVTRIMSTFPDDDYIAPGKYWYKRKNRVNQSLGPDHKQASSPRPKPHTGKPLKASAPAAFASANRPAASSFFSLPHTHSPRKPLQVVQAVWPADYKNINVPDDNHCLFWAAALGLLLPTLNDDSAFAATYQRLFGTDGSITLESKRGPTQVNISDADTQKEVRAMLRTYDCQQNTPLQFQIKTLEKFVCQVFRNRVVDQMEQKWDEATKESVRIESGKSDWAHYARGMRAQSGWGGEPEIRAISQIMQVNIQVSGNGYNREYKTDEAKNTTLYLVHTNAKKTAEANNHYHFSLRVDLYNLHVKRPVGTVVDNIKGDAKLHVIRRA